MLDLSEERELTFREVARRLPRRRKGRKIAISTLYRWARHGLRGVRLETLCVGGSTCTSQEALQRFFERLSSAPRHDADPAPGASKALPDDLSALDELRNDGW